MKAQAAQGARPQDQGRGAMRVIGIDPGSRITGYGVVERAGTKLVHVASGSIEAFKEEQNFADRLVIIYKQLIAVMEEYKPQSAGVEGVFHARNAQSAIKLGHARGVALLAASLHGLTVFEYPPTLVKQAVVGYGRADKVQVQKMVSMLLGVTLTGPADTSDALAIAICHLHSQATRDRLR
jgi:crossover junction endodeoxyribonuclease RuvC